MLVFKHHWEVILCKVSMFVSYIFLCVSVCNVVFYAAVYLVK